MTSSKEKILSILGKLPNSFAFTLFMISFVAAFRFVGEWLILDGQTYLGYGFLIHHIAFYLAMFVINISILRLFLKKDWSCFYGIAGVGVLLGILPVIIDASFIDAGVQRYHYFPNFNFWFLSDIQPLGETIAAWTWIIGFAAYIHIVSSSWLKAGLALLMIYCTAQFAGWGSYVCRDYILSVTLLKVPGDHFFTMWWLLIAFGLAVLGHWDQFKSAFKRIHHTFIWGALVLLGAKLIGYIDGATVLRAFIMCLSFLFIMLVNDYFDKETDRINKRESAITWDMVLFVIYLHIILVFTAGEVDIPFGIFTFLFFILGLGYSIPNILQLKRNWLLGSLVEGIGAALCVLVGGTQFGPPLNQYFLLLVVLIGTGFMLSSNIKDYKDFHGDHESGISTLYVLLHKRSWPFKHVNFMLGGVILLTHFASCFVLYLLNARAKLILIAIVLSFVPSIILLKMPTPSASVKYALLAITAFVFYLVWAMPRMPI